MATNLLQKLAQRFETAVSSGVTSEDPIVVSQLAAVAQTDRDSDGNSSVIAGIGSHDLSVKAHDGSANKAIAKWDPVYYNSSATPLLNADPSGVLFGLAMEAITAGSTDTIEVMLLRAVTDPRWFLPIPLPILRETSAFDVGAIAANGGLLASDTTPVLDAINGATDGCQRVLWASSNSDAIMFQTALPPNLDVDKPLELHIRAAMGGTTDTPDITLASFFNEGDTSVADTISAITGASYAEYIGTVAAADIPSGAQTLSCQLTPGAHTTDTLAISAIWLEGRTL